MAHKVGLKVLLGAWIGVSEEENQREIKRLVHMARAYRHVVEAVIVGNEVILRGDQTEAQMIRWFKKVKEALPDVPVTHAEVWGFWTLHPKLARYVDFLTIHVLPYWEDDPQAIPHVVEHLDQGL